MRVSSEQWNNAYIRAKAHAMDDRYLMADDRRAWVKATGHMKKIREVIEVVSVGCDF